MPMKVVDFEDNEDRQAAMRECLADRFPQFDHCFFSDPREVIRFLTENLSGTILVSLDPDQELLPDGNGGWLDPGTGREVADFLATQPPACPAVVHSTNAPAALGMRTALEEAGWAVRCVVPHDDLEWIPGDWFRAVRRAIVDSAVPAPREVEARK